MTKQPNKGGRPRMHDERMVVLPVRVTPDMRDKFYRIGGAEKFREWLRRCKDVEPEKIQADDEEPRMYVLAGRDPKGSK